MLFQCIWMEGDSTSAHNISNYRTKHSEDLMTIITWTSAQVCFPDLKEPSSSSFRENNDSRALCHQHVPSRNVLWHGQRPTTRLYGRASASCGNSTWTLKIWTAYKRHSNICKPCFSFYPRNLKKSITISIKIWSSTTVFNTDNNQKYILSSKLVYYNDFWRSCDTEDWSNDAHHRNKSYFNICI